MGQQLGFRLGGSGSEFLDVRLIGRSEWTDSVEGWSDVEVCIHAGGFRAAYRASFMAEDFASFLDGLRQVWKTLAGEAVFRPFEEQLFLRVAGNGRGGVEVTGEAWDMSPGNRLRFGLSLDQTYLEEPIRQLEATVAQMALRSKPAG
jgi:hypothetical protein